LKKIFQSDGYHDNNERSEEIGQTKIYKGNESLKKHSEAFNNSKNWAMSVDTAKNGNCLINGNQCSSERNEERGYSKDNSGIKQSKNKQTIQ